VLLGTRIRDLAARGGILFLFGALDHDAVVERLDIAHFNPSPVIDWVGKRAASLALDPGECQRPRRHENPRQAGGMHGRWGTPGTLSRGGGGGGRLFDPGRGGGPPRGGPAAAAGRRTPPGPPRHARARPPPPR